MLVLIKGGSLGWGEISFCHDKLSITKILKSMYILAHYLTLVSSINILNYGGTKLVIL